MWPILLVHQPGSTATPPSTHPHTSLQLWVAIGLTCVAVALILWAVDRAALRVRGRSLDCEEAEELPSLHRRMWASVGMFMMVSVQLPPHAPV